MAKLKKSREYVELDSVTIKSGALFLSRPKDPSDEMSMAIQSFLKKESKKHNNTINSMFEIEEGKYSKYEFFWLPARAQIGSDDVAFKMPCDFTILYAKEKSLIYFNTAYLFNVVGGCGNKGTIRAFGGKNYELEEIYYSKITSLQASHEEELYTVINDGCFAKEEQLNINKDGFKIRSGDNFTVYAADKQSQELAQARKAINSRVAEFN